MTLEEQLRELRANILRDISDIAHGGLDDRLFTDDSLLMYIKDAEMKFAKQTLCILDSTTPAVATVTLKTGVTTYMLNPAVISVLSAKFTGHDYNLKRIGQANIRDGVAPEAEEFRDPAVTAATAGEPKAYFTDETTIFAGRQTMTFTVYPAPSSTENNDTVNLRVIRTPITLYRTDTLERESEIPEDNQLDVMHWAAFRALSNFDADKGAAIPSDKHKEAFEAAVKEAKKANRMRLHAPATVQYGGNGFNW